MNDEERELWIMNDECMYNQWKRSKLSIKAYIKKNRDELTDTIRQFGGK